MALIEPFKYEVELIREILRKPEVAVHIVAPSMADTEELARKIAQGIRDGHMRLTDDGTGISVDG